MNVKQFSEALKPLEETISKIHALVAEAGTGDHLNESQVDRAIELVEEFTERGTVASSKLIAVAVKDELVSTAAHGVAAVESALEHAVEKVKEAVGIQSDAAPGTTPTATPAVDVTATASQSSETVVPPVPGSEAALLAGNAAIPGVDDVKVDPSQEVKTQALEGDGGQEGQSQQAGESTQPQ